MKLPTWLIGGIVGALVILLYDVLALILVFLGFTVPLYFFVYYPTLLFATLFGFGMSLQGWQTYFISFFMSPFFYFVLGSIIGLVVQKMKSESS